MRRIFVALLLSLFGSVWDSIGVSASDAVTYELQGKTVFFHPPGDRGYVLPKSPKTKATVRVTFRSDVPTAMTFTDVAVRNIAKGGEYEVIAERIEIGEIISRRGGQMYGETTLSAGQGTRSRAFLAHLAGYYGVNLDGFSGDVPAIVDLSSECLDRSLPQNESLAVRGRSGILTDGTLMERITPSLDRFLFVSRSYLQTCGVRWSRNHQKIQITFKLQLDPKCRFPNLSLCRYADLIYFAYFGTVEK